MSKHNLDFRWEPRNRVGPKTPSWKETYRQRCMDRLRDKRFKHLLTRRQTDESTEDGFDSNGKLNKPTRKEEMLKDIQMMMRQEWDVIKQEEMTKRDRMLENVSAPSVDEMIELMEEILDELRMEKSCQSSEEFCEEYVKREEDELCQVFQRLNAVEVICPLCQKNCLTEKLGLISCPCGLSIDTQQDCINLKNVSDNLQSGTADHEKQCEENPVFCQMNDFGISTLVMACESCDFHYIIV